MINLIQEISNIKMYEKKCTRIKQIIFIEKSRLICKHIRKGKKNDFIILLKKKLFGTFKI